MFDILHYAFFVRALLAGLCIGAAAPLLGMFVTVRRQSLIADTLAHASLAGVAIGAALGIDPLLAAAVCAVLAAVVIERLRVNGKLSGESTLAIVLSGSLALAVVIMSATGNLNAGVISYLFGGITTVSQLDLYSIAIISGIAVLFYLATHKVLFLIAFDEDIARAQGVPVDRFSLFLAILTAAIVAVGMRVVGVLLVGALMTVPVLAAVQFGLSFKKTAVLAVLFSVLSVLIGLFASSYLDLAAGGTIVLLAMGFFLAGLLYKSAK
ncbi:MAG: metal ABC transporter permease [Patescibacteria group bacterium]|jgi:zinc transport system permease protein